LPAAPSATFEQGTSDTEHGRRNVGQPKTNLLDVRVSIGRCSDATIPLTWRGTFKPRHEITPPAGGNGGKVLIAIVLIFRNGAVASIRRNHEIAGDAVCVLETTSC
jgi:hypothetical protein